MTTAKLVHVLVCVVLCSVLLCYVCCNLFVLKHLLLLHMKHRPLLGHNSMQCDINMSVSARVCSGLQRLMENLIRSRCVSCKPIKFLEALPAVRLQQSQNYNEPAIETKPTEPPPNCQQITDKQNSQVTTPFTLQTNQRTAMSQKFHSVS